MREEVERQPRRAVPIRAAGRRLQERADTPVMRQLMHVGDPYRYEYKLDDDAASTVSADDEYEQRQRQKQGKGLR